MRLFGPANEFGGVVHAGLLDTALGPIPATGVENGREALCLVRADGIEITAAPPDGGHGYVRMRVETARVLGPMSYLLLKPVAGRTCLDGHRRPIEARLPGIHCRQPAARYGRAQARSRPSCFALESRLTARHHRRVLVTNWRRLPGRIETRSASRGQPVGTSCPSARIPSSRSCRRLRRPWARQ